MTSHNPCCSQGRGSEAIATKVKAPLQPQSSPVPISSHPAQGPNVHPAALQWQRKLCCSHSFRVLGCPVTHQRKRDLLEMSQEANFRETAAAAMGQPPCPSGMQNRVQALGTMAAESHLASSAKRGPDHAELCCSFGGLTQHPWCPWPPHHHRSPIHTVLPCSLLGGSCPKQPVQGKDKCSTFPSTPRNLVGKKLQEAARVVNPLQMHFPQPGRPGCRERRRCCW